MCPLKYTGFLYSLISLIYFYTMRLIITNKTISLPLFINNVAAGFPSPAQDFIEKQIDLNELMIKHPAATYLVKVAGDSMVDANINTGDLLIVDSALTAADGDIVIAAINGEFTVKKLSMYPKVRLVPMNDRYTAIEIANKEDLILFGVVTYIIHKV